jgi:hypothetical protein
LGNGILIKFMPDDIERNHVPETGQDRRIIFK